MLLKLDLVFKNEYSHISQFTNIWGAILSILTISPPYSVFSMLLYILLTEQLCYEWHAFSFALPYHVIRIYLFVVQVWWFFLCFPPDFRGFLCYNFLLCIFFFFTYFVLMLFLQCYLNLKNPVCFNLYTSDILYLFLVLRN